MNETVILRCPNCNQPCVPLSPHDRQALALANSFSWFCPHCFAVSDGTGSYAIEDVKAQERAHFMAIIKSFQTITSPNTLLEICEGLRAGLASSSPTRHAWEEVAPELLHALWETMERIGGATPSAAPVVTTKLGIARGSDDESYIRKVLGAINEVVRWSAERTEKERTRASKSQDGPLVVLHGLGEEPVVAGKTKKKMTTPQYNVVKAVLAAGVNGLTKDQLDRKSGHGDARKILKRLADSDPDWRAVIQFPGSTGKRYRIK